MTHAVFVRSLRSAVLAPVLAVCSCVILASPAHGAATGLSSCVDACSDPATTTVRDQSTGIPTGKRLLADDPDAGGELHTKFV